MKRRGFLAAVAALPLMPFVGKRDAAAARGRYIHRGAYIVGERGPELEAFSTALRDAAATADWAGAPYPIAFGKIPDGAVTGTVIDAERLIVSFCDGPCSRIEMYDGHAPLGYDRDFDTVEELRQSTGRLGYYSTCLAAGVARPYGSINARPAYEWAALVTPAFVSIAVTESPLTNELKAIRAEVLETRRSVSQLHLGALQ